MHEANPVFREFFVERGFTDHERMVMHNVRLKYEDVEALIYMECSNVSLETLSLVGNRLESQSLCAIGKQLSLTPLCWPALTALNLSYNKIDTATMHVLVTGLTNATSVRTLEVAGCSIQPNTAHVLAEYLRTDRHIREINAAFNTFSAMGAISFASAIAVNTTMVIVNLRGNGMGYAGGMAIADALRSNYMMKQLCLVDNQCGEEVMALVSGRLRSTLKDVVVSVRASETDLPSWYEEGRFTDWQPKRTTRIHTTTTEPQTDE